VIEELIALAKEIREAGKRGEDLKLSEDEVAFYDALETNDSAVKALGDQNLRFIAQEVGEDHPGKRDDRLDRKAVRTG
jgi:type I restriction enzyme, R subunit